MRTHNGPTAEKIKTLHNQNPSMRSLVFHRVLFGPTSDLAGFTRVQRTYVFKERGDGREKEK